MSVFLAYGLTDKNKNRFIYLSFLFPISIILLMFFNNSSLTLYQSGATSNLFALYMSYFAVSCGVCLFFNLVAILKNYVRFRRNPFHHYGDEFRLLLTQRNKLLKRAQHLKKIHYAMVDPSKSFLGNLEKNKKQYRFVAKNVGSREHALAVFKELTVLETKLNGEKPFLKADAHELYMLAFYYEYERLMNLFSIK